MSSGLYSSAPLVSSGGPQPLTPQTPQDEDGVVVQQYLGVAASNLVDRDKAALSVVKSSVQQRDQASNAVTQAAVTLTSDEVAENRSLTLLVKDVATLEHAGVCATVTITAPAPIPSAPTGSTSTPATLVPTTTTTSTVPATTSTTTTTTTTTTTDGALDHSIQHLDHRGYHDDHNHHHGADDRSLNGSLDYHDHHRPDLRADSTIGNDSPRDCPRRDSTAGLHRPSGSSSDLRIAPVVTLCAARA